MTGSCYFSLFLSGGAHYCATRTVTQEQKKTKDPWPGSGLQDAASEA
jgi:hypothetical protein